jgi:serine/threonine protein kinase
MRFDDKFFQRFLSGNSTDEEFQQVESYLNNQPGVSLADYENADDTLVTLLQKNQAPLEFSDAGDASFDDPSWEIIAQNLNRQFSLATRQLDISQYVDPAQAEDELGRVGEYRLLKQIGSGGMGIVFEAEHAQTNQRVAVKLMNPMLAANPEAAYRFRRESLAAAELKHENIVRISEVDQTSSIPYLVMELLQGESLAHRLRTQTRLPAAKIIEYSIQIAEALQFAHQHGLLHRDIKPDNIWIDGNEIVKLLDFGLARTIDDQTGLTQTGAILGTPKYMSPEQAKGHSVDQRSDLFSLGSVMYEMLFGRPAFDRENFYSTIIAVANEDITSVDSDSFSDHNQLHQLVAQLLKKDPKQRIESAAALKKKLQAIDPDQIPVATSPSNGKGNVWKSVLLGFAAASILFVLSLIIYVQTDRGTLVIDASDDVEVSIINQTIKIRELGSEKEYQLSVGTNRLPSGAYEIVVTDPATGLELSTTHFSLKRGDRQLVSVGLKDIDHSGQAASAGGDKSLKPDGQSITNVFSELNIGKQLAITPNNSFNRFGIVPNPKTIDGIQNWSIETEQHRLGIRHPAFNFDGTLLAACSADAVRIWEYANGKRQLRHLIPTTGFPLTVRWSPVRNDLVIGTVSYDQHEPFVTYWHIGDSVTFLDKVSEYANDIAWSPSGTKLAIRTGGGKTSEILFYEMNGERFHGVPNFGITGSFTQRPWSHDEQLFAVTNTKRSNNGRDVSKSIDIWDFEKRNIFHQFAESSEPIWSDQSRMIGFAKFTDDNSVTCEFIFYDFEQMLPIAQREIITPERIFAFGTSNYIALPVKEIQRSTNFQHLPDALSLVKFETVASERNQFQFLKSIHGVQFRSLAVDLNGEVVCAMGNDLYEISNSETEFNFKGFEQHEAVKICAASGRVATAMFTGKTRLGSVVEFEIFEYESGKSLLTEVIPVPNESSLFNCIGMKFSPSGDKVALSFFSSTEKNDDNKQKYICKVVNLQTKQTTQEIVGWSWTKPDIFWTRNEKALVFDAQKEISVFDLNTGSFVQSVVSKSREPGQSRDLDVNLWNRLDQLYLAGTTDSDVIWYLNAKSIYKSPLSGGGGQEFVNFPKLLSQHNKELSISTVSLVAWNFAKKQIAIAADVTDRTSYPRSGRKAIFVIETEGESPKIVREFNVDNDGHFGKLAFTDNGRFVVCLTQPIDQIRDNNTRTVSGASHLSYYDLESESNQQDPLLTFDKSIAPEIYVGTDSVAFNQFGISYVHNFEKKSVSVFHNQSASELTEVRGHWLACDSSLIRGIGTRPFEQYAYLINYFDTDHDYSGIVFGEDSIRKIPPNNDLSGLYFVEISGDNNQHFRTLPLSDAINQHPELVQGATAEKTVVKDNAANRGENTPSDSAVVGIEKTAKPQSILNVFSPEKVGKQFAIEPSSRLGDRSPVTEPIKLPDVATWAIEFEKNEGQFVEQAFSFDGQFLAKSTTLGTIQIWKINEQEDNTIEHIIPYKGSVKKLAWSPVQNLLLAGYQYGDKGSVVIWKIGETVTVLDQVSLTANELAWSPTGTKVAVQSEQVFLFDVTDGRFKGIPNQGISGEISQRPWSFDEKYFAYSNSTGIHTDGSSYRVEENATCETTVVNMLEGRVHQRLNQFRNAAWSSKSPLMACWHLAKGKLDPDRVEFWDMESLKRVKTFSREHGEYILDWNSTSNKFAVVESRSVKDSEIKLGTLRYVDFEHVRDTSKEFAFDHSIDTGQPVSRNTVVGPGDLWAGKELFLINEMPESDQWSGWYPARMESDEAKSIHVGSNQVATIEYRVNPSGKTEFRLLVHDCKTGEILISEKLSQFGEGIQQSIWSTFSPSGKLLLLVNQAQSGSDTNYYSMVFDLQEKKKVFQELFSVGLVPSRFTSDEKCLVKFDRDSIELIDIETKVVKAQFEMNARRSYLHFINGERAIWSEINSRDRKIVEADFASGETKILFRNSDFLALMPDAETAKSTNVYWNERLRRLALPIEIDAVYVISLQKENPQLLAKHVGETKTHIQRLQFSESGKELCYLTTVDSKDPLGRTEYTAIFIDLERNGTEQQKLLAPFKGYRGVQVGMTIFPVESGFWFADQMRSIYTLMSSTLDQSVSIGLPTVQSIQSNEFGYLAHTTNSVVQIDHQGKILHTVFLQPPSEDSNKIGYGKVGNERFGPWVKEAAGMYLVTVSDDPEVGIVTRPLDSVRSVYPELFQE